MKSVNGDIGRLSSDELNLIQVMEKRYGDKINQSTAGMSKPKVDFDILTTPFAEFVRKILTRDLGHEFSEEEAVVAHVFNNKWLPIDCQDEELVDSVFERFEADIVEANQWREDLVATAKDKRMAVSMTWFMVIFQLHKRLQS